MAKKTKIRKKLNKKDWKNRTLLFKPQWTYLVDEDGVKIERNWNELYHLGLNDSSLNVLFNTYSKEELREIFISLHRLNKSVALEKSGGKHHNEKWSEKLEKRKENAINRALKKVWDKWNVRVTYIVAADKAYSIGKDNNLLWNMKTHLLNIEQLVHGQIVIVGEKTSKSKWFNELDLSDTEVRIYNSDNYNIPELALEKHEGDKREIFVLGGEYTYKQFWNYMKDLWISFVDDYNTEADAFFTEISIINYELMECLNIEKDEEFGDNIDYNISHLRLYNKRQSKWKNNTIKYLDYNKQLEL